MLQIVSDFLLVGSLFSLGEAIIIISISIIIRFRGHSRTANRMWDWAGVLLTVGLLLFFGSAAAKLIYAFLR